jgi:hypothetical protein
MGIDSRFFKPNWESYPFFLSFFSITLKTPAGLLLLLFQWLSLFLFHSQKKENGQEKNNWKYSQKKKKKR